MVTKQGLCNSCNMGARDLPDMYARSPRAAGPRDEGIHIRQIMSAHVTSNMYHLRAWASAKRSSLMHTFAELLLYTHLRRFDCGFRISFQEHVLQIISKTSAQKETNGECNKYSTIVHFALYKKRVLHCISVLLYSNYCHASNSL